MKLEDRPDTGVVHDRLEDCSSRRRVTGVEREVCDLLELQPGQRPWLRLSDAWWRRVDALVARIEQPAVPVDFQIQPQSWANEKYGNHRRSALIEVDGPAPKRRESATARIGGEA